MADKPNPFKQLVNAKKAEDSATTPATNKVKAARDEPATPTESPSPTPTATTQPAAQPSTSTPVQRKRGRPATGKRSHPDWLGRTYYVKQDTDLDVEEELLNLKRQGIEIDKSELVDGLLAAWVKWRNGEQANGLLGKISPRRK